MTLFIPQMEELLDAESGVLGSVLLNDSVMDDVASLLEPRDFSREIHSLIWKGMLYKYQNNQPIDMMTMTESLVRYERLEEIGGVGYLSKLANSVPSAANADYYAQMVRSNAYRRRGVEAGGKIIRLTNEEEFESDEAYFTALEKVALGVRPTTGGNMKHVSETRKEFFDWLDTEDDLIKTGFKSFDEWMGGIGRGWLYIKAGRPSVGKTANALQTASGIASNSDNGQVLIWSQEMKRAQLLTRMLSSKTNMPISRIRRKGELTPEEKEKLRKAYDQLELLPLHIEDAKNVTIHEVKATARKIKRRHGKIGAILIDYLQIMNIPVAKGSNRSQAIGEVTRAAKQTAFDLDCPIILLSQLSREGAKAEEPKLEHLRESGEIEQDADVVEFLWHNTDEKHKSGAKVVESIIAKGRDVGVNKFKYLFHGWNQKYEEWYP
ncbi:Replicative DNA helicase [compost metagenome]